MITQYPFPLKKLSPWFSLVSCGFVTAYIIFIGIVSIRIGLAHLHHDGFWVPVLAGTFLITFILCVFLRFLKYIIKILRENDHISI